MDWFKWLWGNKQYKISEGVDLSYEIGQFPIIEEVKKDISEPVWAIVECMKKYPSRWKVINGDGLFFDYKLEDIKTKETFEVAVITPNPICPDYTFNDLPVVLYLTSIINRNWMTQDECSLITGAMERMQEVKMQRVRSIGKIKRDGDRKRLMEIYK